VRGPRQSSSTHILAWEGTEENPDNWYWFEGNFESYEENKIERLESGAVPRLIRTSAHDDEGPSSSGAG
jgi:hypothetical protein